MDAMDQEKGLVDSFKRKINYLRISVTDRCNLRCVYCMPEKGINTCSADLILSYEEIERFSRIAVGKGVRKIRITGGEPLVRRGLPGLMRKLSAIEGLEDLGMTTNGVLLKEYARELCQAGLKRVNVSLDSLRPDRYSEITRGAKLIKVLEGLEEVEKTSMRPIKINVVAIKGRNDDEIIDFAKLTLTRPYQVRFIEFMPLDGDGRWSKDQYIPASDIVARISSWAKLTAVEEQKLRGPAKLYRIEGGCGEVGVISPISDHNFCSNCNRLRLTADGKLRSCLFSDEETDLRAMLRGGADDEPIRELLDRVITYKPEKHFLNEGFLKKCSRTMSLIGG